MQYMTHSVGMSCQAIAIYTTEIIPMLRRNVGYLTAEPLPTLGKGCREAFKTGAKEAEKGSEEE